MRRCIFEEESCVAAGPRRTCREGELRTSQAFQLLSWPGCVVRWCAHDLVAVVVAVVVVVGVEVVVVAAAVVVVGTRTAVFSERVAELSSK